MSAVAPFESAFRGLLSYATMLQAAVEVCAQARSSFNGVLYRGMSDGDLAGLFRAAVGEVIAWPGFIVGAHTIGEAVEAAGGPRSVALVFRVLLTPEAVAVEIGGFAERVGESRMIVAAESLFKVESVGEVNIGEMSVPEVSLLYAGAWSDRNIDLDFVSAQAPIWPQLNRIEERLNIHST
jgi:hypothetical protein